MPETKITSESWIDFMLKGSFAEAWKFSDHVLKAGLNRDHLNLPRHYQCIWDGTPLDGKRVLIRCYHGLGDTIMFIRYAPLVKKVAKEVIVWTQPKLIPLLATAEGIDRLIPLHDGTPEVEYDTDVEIMELPWVFRSNLATIPSRMPYLHVEPLPFISEKPRIAVGIIWKAGNWDPSRNIPFELLHPLFGIPGVEIFILQDNAAEARWQPGYGIHPGKCTLTEHARIIKGLDLMISIDSMPAHLAGALNVSSWLLLSKNADWRWMENRSDSPWYPSMRIFRQEEQGNWIPVIEQIYSELYKLSNRVHYPEEFRNIK